MILTNEFDSQFADAELYELPALCFQNISSKYWSQPVAFLSKYIDPIFDGSSMSEYKSFWDGIRKGIQKCRETGRDDIDNIKKCISDQLACLQIPAGSSMEDARSICMFIIMVELDNFIRATEDEMKDKEVTACHKNGNGPLNKNFDKDQFLVYRKEEDSFVARANSDKENGFRNILTTRYLGDRFNALQIISKKRLPGKAIPKAISVHLGEKTKKAAEKLKMVKIAVIPYISFDTFCFHEVRKRIPVDPGKPPKNLFYVEYSNEKKLYVEQVVFLLNKAIEAKANIVVFPEFIMSPTMLNAVKAKLETLNGTEEESLWAVFAGSTYEYDKTTKRGNNVLHILNNRGIEIGKYYKFNPFYKDDSAKKAEKKGYVGVSICELLSDPGKEICFIDIPRIGRILPAVCKDAIESNYTIRFAKVFHPSMQIIPAWSTSVSSFDSGLCALANQDHVTSVVCNCCNAVQFGEAKGAIEIGTAYLPKKVEKRMKTEPDSYRRTDECYRICKEGSCKDKKTGCIHFIDINIDEILPSWNIQPGVTFDE